MKNKLIALSGLVTLLATTAAYGVMAQQPGAPPAQRTFAAQKGKERHPELRKALRALNNAQKFLQQANKDFDGHREQALDLTQKAIDQVQQAIASDKK
jgi:hypothetical protein